MVPSFQPSKMDPNGTAWPAPLLKLPLPSGAGGPPTPEAGRALCVVHHIVISHKDAFSALCSGQSLGPCTTNPVRESRRRRLHTCFTLPELTVHAQQMLLPPLNGLTAESIKGPVARILMQTNTFGGRLVRLCIEIPMPLRHAPVPSILQSEVRLYPMDPSEPIHKSKNLGPEVLMRTLWPFPSEEPVQPVMHITTVSENNQGTCECRDGHEDCVDLRSLGGLPWSRQGPGPGVNTMGLENKPPACPTTMSVNTSSICGDFTRIIPGGPLRESPTRTFRDLPADGPGIETQRHRPCITTTPYAWPLHPLRRQTCRAMIHEMFPICNWGGAKRA